MVDSCLWAAITLAQQRQSLFAEDKVAAERLVKPKKDTKKKKVGHPFYFSTWTRMAARLTMRLRRLKATWMRMILPWPRADGRKVTRPRGPESVEPVKQPTTETHLQKRKGGNL